MYKKYKKLDKMISLALFHSDWKVRRKNMKRAIKIVGRSNDKIKRLFVAVCMINRIKSNHLDEQSYCYHKIVYKFYKVVLNICKEV